MDKAKMKRERSINFTSEKTNLLVSLVDSQKNIIENKKSDAMSWQEKRKAWKDIEKSFNSTAAGSVFRDHKHLKLKYEALKRDTRKKNALVRTERYRTGGGTSTAPTLTIAEEKIKEMIILSVEGNESQFDSDLVLPSTSSPVIISVPTADEQDPTDLLLTNDSSKKKCLIEEQESEPLKKKVCGESQKKTALQSDSKENLWKEWTPKALKSKKHPVLSKQKEKRPFDKLTEEKLEISKIQKQLVTEELEQKLIQRKLLEKEVEHKEIIQKLEKEHLILKIKLLKKELGEV